MPQIEIWHWIAFSAFVAVMLFLDLFVFHRHARETTLREAGFWTVVWCLLAIAFNLLLWYWLGGTAAKEFLTGYLIEWSLSMDNVFVFAIIFTFFRVPKKHQHRVLFWGILGAVFMRLTFILVGSSLIARFEWILPLLGLVLVYSGFKLAFSGESEVHPEKNIILRAARAIMPVSKGETGNHFFVREAGRLCVTPLFLVLLVVESTDVVFAVDSVPAIFGVVDQNAAYFTFVVFTSNVFAILGLRALYFLLAGAMDVFRYLRFGLAAILVFVGLKMCAEWLTKHVDALKHLRPIEHDGHPAHLVPPTLSLIIVVSLLGLSVIASLIALRRERKHAGHTPDKTDGETTP